MNKLNQKNPWIEYWSTDHIWSHSAFWRKQMEVFIRLTSNIMDYSETDTILDFGCGSGHFAEIMSHRIGSIVCADMSENYIQLCANKFADVSNVNVVEVKPDLSDLYKVGTAFNKVICFSVVHYFPDIDCVTRFLKGIQNIIVPGGKLLIGDIGNNKRSLNDYIKAVLFTLRQGMFLDALRLMTKVTLSDPDYSKIKQGGNSYLHIPDSYFMDISRELGIEITFLSSQLTVNSNYKHVLVEY
mgnify:FL=1